MEPSSVRSLHAGHGARRRAEVRGGGRPRGPGRVIAFPSPGSPAESTGRIGLWVVLGAWTMLLAPLVIAVYRMRVGGGEGGRALRMALDAVYPPAAGAVLVLGLANYALWRGREALPEKGPWAARWLRIGAAWLGVFLALKGWLMARAFAAGLDPTATHAGSLWFGVACLQLAAALVGASGVALLVLRLARGTISPARPGSFRLWCTYCHVTSLLSAITFFVVRAP